MNIFSLIKHLFNATYEPGSVEDSRVTYLYLPIRNAHAQTLLSEIARNQYLRPSGISTIIHVCIECEENIKEGREMSLTGRKRSKEGLLEVAFALDLKDNRT